MHSHTTLLFPLWRGHHGIIQFSALSLSVLEVSLLLSAEFQLVLFGCSNGVLESPLWRDGFTNSLSSVGICPNWHSLVFSPTALGRFGVGSIFAYYKRTVGRHFSQVPWHMLLDQTTPTEMLLFVDVCLFSCLKKVRGRGRETRGRDVSHAMMLMSLSFTAFTLYVDYSCIDCLYFLISSLLFSWYL